MSKFLMAMGGVVLSSLIIFVGLSLYNKFLQKKRPSVEKSSVGSSLSTPKSFKDSVMVFLEKTR